MKNKYFIILLLNFILSILFFTGSKSLKNIAYHRLNRETLIIGSLGKPLGEIIHIQGYITKEDSKLYEDELLLKIIKVDNTELLKPVIIPFQIFDWTKINKLKFNEPFNYIGYETGRMTGIPEKAFDYIPRVAAENFSFRVYFQICSEVK